MQEKFEILKSKFKEAPIRAYPIYNSPEKFILTTDFSKDNLGAVLSQVQNGQEKMIAAIGRKTTTYEANYESYKGELAAIIWGLRKFDHILRFKPFKIKTDSGALKYVQNIKKPQRNVCEMD